MKIFKTILIAGVFGLLLGSCTQQENNKENNLENPDTTKYVLVIHGGAGAISKDEMTPELEKQYRSALEEALKSGYDAIQSGKTSVEAVQAAINILEDSPLFNAGKGAVFNNDGKNEMDASIMDGGKMKAGAVAEVSNLKNPIDGAIAVMEKSEHVMLAGKGAEDFAASVGLEIVDPSYFWTEKRWQELLEARDGITDERTASLLKKKKKKYLGTVGAVALDKNGNIAAGTSTGGMTNKKYGRIGDSPIIGAGTYANNATAGISCTGSGEYFIREVAAHRISDLIELKGLSLEDAISQTLKEIGDVGGDGGMIGLNKKGEYSMQFNTEGMYRGVVDEKGNISVAIYDK